MENDVVNMQESTICLFKYIREDNICVCEDKGKPPAKCIVAEVKIDCTGVMIHSCILIATAGK